MIDPAIPPLLDDALSRLRRRYGVFGPTLMDLDVSAFPSRVKKPLAILQRAAVAMGRPNGRANLAACQKAHAALLRAMIEPSDIPKYREDFITGVIWRLCVIAVILIIYAHHHRLI